MAVAEGGEAAASSLGLLPIIITSATTGAIISGLFALLGGWLVVRREHEKWKREHRYQAFIRASALAERFRHMRVESDELKGELAEAAKRPGGVTQEQSDRMDRMLESSQSLQREVIDSTAPLEMLGPADVLDAFNALTEAQAGTDEAATEEAWSAYIQIARKSLRI